MVVYISPCSPVQFVFDDDSDGKVYTEICTSTRTEQSDTNKLGCHMMHRFACQDIVYEGFRLIAIDSRVDCPIMADSSTPVYYVVADLPREKKSSLPQREETMESTLSNSPVYDVANIEPVSEDSDSPITADNICYSTANRAHQPQEAEVKGNKKRGKVIYKTSVCFITATTAIAIIALASSVVFSIEIARLKSEITSLKETGSSSISTDTLHKALKNHTAQIEVLHQQLRLELCNNTQQLDKVSMRTQELNTSVEGVFQQLTLSHNNTQELIEIISGDITAIEDKTQLLIDYLQIGQFQDNPAPSCAALRGLSPSGYYWVKTSNGSAVRVYCDMTRSCGGVTGGWARVANIQPHMTNECPEGFDFHIERSECTCRRDSPSAGCSGVQVHTHHLNYSTVCGRIEGLIFGAVDGFVRASNADVDGNYVDGVSLTHGTPRQHIWTFAATFTEQSTCSCSNNIPLSVRNDYFCDTRQRGPNSVAVWGGTDCDGCCSYNNPPWFYKQLPQSTTDNIEMRLCRDEDRRSEDVYIQIAEVYIQ